MITEKAGVVYVVKASLFFPEGFSIGGNGKSNRLEIERDGYGNPVIRGSSIAGLLREEVRKDPRFGELCEWYFGKPLERNSDRSESRLIFFDTPLKNLTDESMHNQICRHTGSVSEINKGLFSMEKVAPGAKGELFFCLNTFPEDQDDDEALLEFLAECLNGGVLFGGNTNRGGGRCFLEENRIFCERFDLARMEESAAYLDLLYAEDRKLTHFRTVARGKHRNRFLVKVVFRIPEGQDLLCSEGNDFSPVSCLNADGHEYWKIPGSTFRGIFKGWMSRLAAREGVSLADNTETFLSQGDRKSEEISQITDPIQNLFGSLGNKGRIHFSDACSNRPVNRQTDIQTRFHVVIDRFTGGTNDGKLFQNDVLIAGENPLLFETHISITDASEKEVAWLSSTLQAIHLGLVRIGSSKAAGRLEVVSVDLLSNPARLQFNTIMKGI